MTKPKITLCILDGWGIRETQTDNAIAMASTPNWDYLLANYPHSQLSTSGPDVGLPEGQMGNSEVGHMNIGSGRVVMQDLPRINHAIETGRLTTNPELISLIQTLKQTGGACHLLGLLSDGGVHSHISHIIALAKVIAASNIQVYLHAFLDGRDTMPGTAAEFIQTFKDHFKQTNRVTIATLSGRYYAMDRDNRWERVKLAYDAITGTAANHASSPESALAVAYQLGQTDEFLIPTMLGSYSGINQYDCLVMANFRTDRARQLLTALVDPDFSEFPRLNIPDFQAKLGLIEYSTHLNRFLTTMFSPETITSSLPEIVSAQDLKQLRIAETEKYAHVTFFFNGGREQKYPGEQRILVPSPQLSSYDLKPEMSAFQLTEKLVEAIQSQQYNLIVVNYANSDMVGHTGNMNAAIKAVEAIDQCLGKILEATQQTNSILIVTADHGNVEQMLERETGKPYTQHTLNPVPFVLAGNLIHKADMRLQNGKLSDIAPTILELFGLDKPAEMSGNSLIVKL